MIARLTLLCAASLLAACASMTTGTSQSLSVETTPVAGASCRLANDKGSWQVSSTPGAVTVSRSYSPLTVTCEKPGHSQGVIAVESRTKATAFGNVLAGGLIGAAVDMGSGAAYDYPALVTVPLVKDGKN